MNKASMQSMGLDRRSAIPVQPVQPSTANSAFAGLNNVTIGLDGLGSAQTLADTNQIKTTFQLHPELQGILGQSRQGLAGGLAATNRSLADDLAALQAGQNAYYNAQHAFNRQAASDAQKAVQARFSQAGLGASSVLGGFFGPAGQRCPVTGFGYPTAGH
ncbi:MAG: hypothetical protein R2857_14495 [Vampirovibrionales bacterium]